MTYSVKQSISVRSVLVLDNIKNRTKQALRPSTRRWIQLYSALLHNAYLKGFIDGEIYQGRAKYACVPGLNCYSCPGAVGACPLGSLQNALASTGHRTGWYVLGIIMLYGVILGRTICGWLCPFGLIQELLHRIPSLKIRKNRLTRVLSWLKYLILAVFAVAIPLWYGLNGDIPVPGFCKYICPAGTFESAAALLSHPGNASMFSMLGILFTGKFVIMLLIALLCIFCYRSFCRFICPLGAIYGLFNRFSIMGVRVDQERCNGCGSCVRSCGMDVRCVGDHECIHCGKCIDVCGQKAITLKAGKVTLKSPSAGTERTTGKVEDNRKKKGRAAWGIAAAVLCIALVWFNVLDPSAHAGNANEMASQVARRGYEVGMQLENFETECLDGSVFSLEAARGKVVFINLWATYCAPCIRELPYFDALYREHEDDVAVIAVHSSIVTDDPAGFIDGKGFAIPFAVDSEDDAIWNIVNGSSTLPQTIVLNRDGVVIYNQRGSVTPEMLSALYRQAAGEQSGSTAR